MPSAPHARAETADRRTRRRPGFAPAAGRVVRRRRADARAAIAGIARAARRRIRSSRWSPTATPDSTRFPSACVRIVTCCRTRSTRNASMRATLREQLDARVAGSRLARRVAGRTAGAVRSDAGNAQARRILAAGQRAATPVRRLVRPRRPARHCWSPKRSRRASIPTGQQRRGRRDPQGIRSGAAPAHHATIALTGPGAFSVEIGGRTQREASWIGTIDTIGLILLLWVAYRSWKVAAARRAAAGQRRPRRPGRGRRCCSTACTASPSRSASP